MRALRAEPRLSSPHPPLRGTFSRREGMIATRFLIAVCNAQANRSKQEENLYRNTQERAL